MPYIFWHLKAQIQAFWLYNIDPWVFLSFKCLQFYFGLFVLGPSFKTCTDEGEWWRHPETNLTWSNYTQCVNLQDLEVSIYLLSTFVTYSEDLRNGSSDKGTF